ncbi:MAG: hypothetical protein ACW98Y_13260 [Candidatus Thorarchaeota archaeon]|jgi:hypothetical protein
MGHHAPMMFRAMRHGPMRMGSSCGCGCYSDQSKETRVKQLEALKSQLQDHINRIDSKITELETEEKAEV